MKISNNTWKYYQLQMAGNKKMPTRLDRADNDMETVIEEAFPNMGDGTKDMEDQENMTKVEVNNLINEVVNEVNPAKLGEDTIESRMEELRKQHTEKIGKYKLRILDLKNQVATLPIGEVGSSISAPIATTDIYLQSLQAERGTTLEEVKSARSQTLVVCTINKVLQRKIEALQKEVVDMQQQFQVVNKVVTCS